MMQTIPNADTEIPAETEDGDDGTCIVLVMNLPSLAVKGRGLRQGRVRHPLTLKMSQSPAMREGPRLVSRAPQIERGSGEPQTLRRIGVPKRDRGAKALTNIKV